MQSTGFNLKKAYYYIICLISFFVLMWGVVDLLSSSTGLVGIQQTTVAPPTDQPESLSVDKGEQYFDAYYQKKMLYDRFWDSLARIVVTGLIFSYARIKVHQLEKAAG